MSEPLPSHGRVFVLAASGVWAAALIAPKVRHGRGVGTKVRIKGARRPITVDSRLVFTARAPATALRIKARVLARTASWCHRTIPQIAVHLLTGGRAP
ncbi:hypothetical protein [Ancylobacter sp. TS-1]|uniref:hypothetical protein n=1 Tax=Ancylobacter sp. TS-1 TaxID=1850374 RepID=UPI001265C232|nr:hypothetical protein [Ancylobacter sp. TS-1]QFR32413.1 hypothetical protein GBB76_04375 [Ancylobacter sp. TS-1]